MNLEDIVDSWLISGREEQFMQVVSVLSYEGGTVFRNILCRFLIYQIISA